MPKLLKRHTVPTSLNKEPYGTLWKCEKEEDRYFVQLNEISERPHWTEMRDFLVKVFSSFIEEHAFMQAILSLYKSDNKSLKDLNNIIKNQKLG